jgi:hypothetical protein
MPAGLSYGKEDRRALDIDRQLVDAAINDLDVMDLTPGAAELFAAASLNEAGPGGGVNAGVIEFQKGNDDYARWGRRVRDAWVNHVAEVTVLYTAVGGSTNNFRVVVSAEATHSGANMSAGPVIDSVAVLAPGPAAGDGVLKFTTTLSATPVTSDRDQLLSFRVLRTGSHASDTNANALQILLVVVVMRPA